jgi:hypothetical protein
MLPESVDEAWVAVENDRFEEAVQSEVGIQKDRRGLCGGHMAGTGAICTILMKLSTKTRIPVRPFASGGKPKTKSILTERQTAVATGSGRSGACGDGEGLTR